MCELIYPGVVTNEQPFTSVWTREPRQAKSHGLSRAQIVRATIDLLDAEGIESFSMRKLGARLGSGATSVYWHVATKDELLELAFDEVFGEIVAFEPGTTTWRNAAAAFAHSMRQVTLAHPWLATLIGRVAGIGPQSLRLGDRLRGTFREAGFLGKDANFACSVLTSYVYGVTIPEITWATVIASTGVDRAEWSERVKPVILKAAAEYPDLVADYEAFSSEDPQIMAARNFDYGLLCVLDGLEARLKS